ncbi:MAG: DNA translocase FtsK 4TM domain-containing protein [Halothiobacillaceae bacterium]
MHLGRSLREALFYLMLAAAIFLLLALASYDVRDPGWSQASSNNEPINLGGWLGAWLADLLIYLGGYSAYAVPIGLLVAGWLVYRGHREDGLFSRKWLAVRAFGFVLAWLAAAALCSLHLLGPQAEVSMGGGGVLGRMVGMSVASLFGLAGGTVVLLALLLSGFTLFSGFSWLALFELIGGWVLAIPERWLARAAPRAVPADLESSVPTQGMPAADEPRQPSPIPPTDLLPQEMSPAAAKPPLSPDVRPISPASAESSSEPRPQPRRARPTPARGATGGGLPDVSLLDPPRPRVGGYSAEALQAMSRLIEERLQEFGVQARVVAAQPGPVITRFELEPAAGVKVSQISNLAKDLARSLAMVSVRVVEVIPGKSTVGLEVPNAQREVIALSEIINSKPYRDAVSPLTLALGKDIAGEPVCADLARMPHLLVAGTTGSGKSVGVNAMLLSMLFKATADEVRLILIDPKMLELSIYEGIPHLLAPVVTDMKEAANALRWAVGEMERRYRLMAALGVRNLAGFNKKVREARESGQPITDPLYNHTEALDPNLPPPELEPLPYIVIVVDEFADMIMVVGKKVEELIARIAQKARAAGIHLIVATQRPSVDVITGLIKANIPTRIAFQVSSKIDSRTILDQMGAETLLGHGDMLFLPPGTGLPMRVHGAFVSDQEVHAVVEALKAMGEPRYIEGVLEEQSITLPGEKPMVGGEGGERDPLYDQAVAIVLESRKASISYVQRRLKIGYNRSARLMEEMERAGVVGPLQANGQREVLVPARE